MTTVITRGAGSAQALGYAARATAANYIEDVFSTYLFTGNGSTQTITNGIDLSGKGGLVWFKRRDVTNNHALVDSARGVDYWLRSNQTAAQLSFSGNSLTAPVFNSNGFVTSNYDEAGGTNAGTYASWTFRKQAKFFDVVTYTGNGVAGRTISHSLGSAPGCLIIKPTSFADNWRVWHRSVPTQNCILNGTDAFSTAGAANRFGDGTNVISPTSTVFTVGSDGGVNNNGSTYVAYLFAHDAGGFGASGLDNVITCGTVTGPSATVTLGYEPQWVMLKRTDSTGNWQVFDNMRGMFAPTQTGPVLVPNTSNAEASPSATCPFVTPTGMSWDGSNNSISGTYIYIAIRRGPMRTPTSGTSVFTPVTYTGDGNADRQIGTTISPDLSIVKARNNTTVNLWVDRLRGSQYLISSSASLEGTVTGLSGGGQIVDTSAQAGIKILLGTSTVNNVNQSGINYVDWNFKRAPGFFDEVCYTGTGSARTVTHNLGATPELMIVKARSVSEGWRVYHSNPGATKRALLYTDDAFAVDSTTWNNTAPTASVFTVGTDNSTNQSGQTLVAYLFGSVTGVSKVGSYTGTGTTNQINCGFTGGSRFVMIKRADGLGEWYIWDSARGIVAGNDPYLWWNSNSAEVTSTDYIDTYSAGFEISSTAPAAINANGGTFIFLAIA